MILGETNLCSKNDNYNTSVEALDNIQEEARNKIIWPFCVMKAYAKARGFSALVPSHFGFNWCMAMIS